MKKVRWSRSPGWRYGTVFSTGNEDILEVPRSKLRVIRGDDGLPRKYSCPDCGADHEWYARRDKTRTTGPAELFTFDFCGRPCIALWLLKTA